MVQYSYFQTGAPGQTKRSHCNVQCQCNFTHLLLRKCSLLRCQRNEIHMEKFSYVPTPDQTKFCRSCMKYNKVSTTFSVTPRSWVSQLLRNFLKFRKFRRSIIHHISPRYILTITVHLHLDIPSGLLTSCFPTNILCTIVLFSCVLHSSPISPFLIWSVYLYLASH